MPAIPQMPYNGPYHSISKQNPNRFHPRSIPKRNPAFDRYRRLARVDA